jgi:hypothetical protein
VKSVKLARAGHDVGGARGDEHDLDPLGDGLGAEVLERPAHGGEVVGRHEDDRQVGGTGLHGILR